MKTKPNEDLKRLEKIQSMINRLTAIADEMDEDKEPAVQAMADHVDCINDELLFQQSLITGNGPIVTFQNGRQIAPERETLK